MSYPAVLTDVFLVKKLSNHDKYQHSDSFSAILLLSSQGWILDILFKYTFGTSTGQIKTKRSMKKSLGTIVIYDTIHLNNFDSNIMTQAYELLK